MEIKQVRDLKHLKELSSKEDKYGNLEYCEVFINFGFSRSSKNITYDPIRETWDIFNLIDDSEQEDLITEQLKTETHIIEALDKGALWYWVD